MIRLLHIQVQQAATRRGPGFLESFMAKAKAFSTHLEIEREDLEQLNQDFPVVGGPVQEAPAPRGDNKPVLVLTTWPLNPFGIAMRALKLMRTEADTGAGDTLARVIGPIGGDQYKVWFKDTFGKTCGCQERQEELNKRFPYETNP